MKVVKRDAKGRFVSTKATTSPVARTAEIKSVLSEKAATVGIELPNVVVSLVVELMGDASPTELDIIKPTPKDPVILYRGEPLVWFFPVKV